MNGDDKPGAWAKLNAYGFVLAALSLLSILDLFHPASTKFAQIVGDVPPGQTWWIAAFGLAGGLLLYGFVRIDRIAETAGLALMTVGVSIQVVVAFWLLGWTEFSLTRLVLLGIIAGCTWARATALWSRDGLTVTIPPRGRK